MDEKVFTQFLNRYRVVRTRDSYVPLRNRNTGSSSSSSGSRASVSEPGVRAALTTGSTTAAVKSAAVVVAPRDFWSGLQSFLDARYPIAQAKAIAAAFDELHYTSIKDLNYEDMDDIAVMIARELGMPPLA